MENKNKFPEPISFLNYHYDVAKEFFSTKNPIKCYPVRVCCSEDGIETVEDMHFVMDDDEFKKHKNFLDEKRRDFLNDYPELADNQEEWEEYISQAYRDEFASGRLATTTYSDHGKSLPYHTIMTHLDNGVNVYRFDVEYVVANNPKLRTTKCQYVELTDEEYINILAGCLKVRDTSVAMLHFTHPEIFNKIASQVIREGFECSVFMTEIRQDSEQIYEREKQKK